MKSHTGFTLVEIMVAMLLTSVIVGGAYAVFNSQLKNTTVQTNVSDVQQTLRVAMDFLARDIRMAGYDPMTQSQFSIRDVRFRNLGDGLSASGNSFIEFSWDKDGDGVVDANEVMNYSLVDNGTITPGVADLYLRYPNDVAPMKNRNVLAGNIVALGLAYALDADDDGKLDVDGGGNIRWVVDWENDNDWDLLTINYAAKTVTTAETGRSVNTRDIRAVRIWMLGQAEAQDPQYLDTNTYIVGPHTVQPNNHFRHRILQRTVLCRNMGLNI